MEKWVEEELEGLYLGDKRLDKRCKLLLSRMGNRPLESVPASLKGWSETQAAYRFFDNASVSMDKIIEPHHRATLKRIEQEEVVLMIQDTTSLDYTTKRSAENLGYLEKEYLRGLYLHPTIAVSSDRLCLGVVDAKLWTRKIEDYGKKQQRKEKPIEEKESYRWIESYHQSCSIAEKVPDTLVVSIGDRENDIYEAFLEGSKQNNKAKFVIRAAQDRSVLEADGEVSHLWTSVEKSPELGTIKIELSKSHKRKKRTAELSIRVKEIKLCPPYRKGNKLGSININAVLLKEKNAPKDSEPIEWLLLTNHTISGFKGGILIVEWYCCRWQIEIYFKILKSGCRVEELHLEKKERLERCIGLYMIIAWRVLYLVMIGRSCPDIPAEVVFDEKEWKIIYAVSQERKPPDEVPKLNEVIKMLASLGGYLGRKSDSPPGPITIWIGLRRTVDFLKGYEAAMRR